jgi:hypothetical protein
MPVSVRLLTLGAALALLVGGFQLVARPWFLNWGATAEEQTWALPGDEIVDGFAAQNTRAITLPARPDRVWPWLAQLGQDRAGFYSYDLLESLAGCRMPIEDGVRPELQAWAPGDRLWMYPPDRAGGVGFATLRAYEPGRALGFATRVIGTGLDEAEDGSWSFVVLPAEGQQTRLLVRGRAAGGRSFSGALFDRLIFEPAHFVMERRMMVSLGLLARGLDRDRWRNHLEVALWTITFGVFVTAGVLTFRRPDWVRVVAAFWAAGLVFQVLTLAQPPLPLGAVLAALPILLIAPPPPLSLHRTLQDLAGPP